MRIVAFEFDQPEILIRVETSFLWLESLSL
jgi:hypothetical protein